MNKIQATTYKRMAVAGVLLGIAAAVAVSCGPGLSAQGEVLVESNTQFALDFHRHLSANNDGNANIFFSPFSISTAFAIAQEGARGDTAAEIREVFGFPEEDISGDFRALRRIFDRGNGYQLNTANGLWLQEDHPFLEEYRDTAAEDYGARLEEVNFKSNASAVVKEINDWVSDATEGKIARIVNNLSPEARLAIANAIYFKGDWENPFEEPRTTNGEFNAPAGYVMVPLMRQHDEFRYADIGFAQILQLPYEGDDLSMLILLPKDVDGAAAELERELTSANLAAWRGALDSREVRVELPRFKFETEYNLIDELRAMGLDAAFLPNGDDCSGSGANFEGIDGTRCLHISQAQHQAVVEVNEEGTEAAAGTILKIVPTSTPSYPLFRADRPFTFLIQHDESGAILFMGQVNDPTAG